MARLGTALGWPHYSAGWHATCTAGAPASAAAAGVALGLAADQIASAMALAVPGAGGVQRAFGTDGKALQVGFAVNAGIRAARLVMAGARADPAALDQWLGLVGGDPGRLDLAGPAVPGGLAIKIYPCCYALQRPISAMAELASGGLAAADVRGIVVRTPAATVAPLIHHRPQTGLQGKFSLEYGVAAALLDRYRDSAASPTRPCSGPRRGAWRSGSKRSWPGRDRAAGRRLHGRGAGRGRLGQRGQPAVPAWLAAAAAVPRQLRAKLADCVSGLPVDPPR